ncbi:MAG: NAD(P)-dependent oxidoreductase [Erythrobacter sp.]
MDKIFIAGGTGMLGAATAEAFADAGVQVVVSSRKDTDPIGDRLQAYSDLISVARLDLAKRDQVQALFEAESFDGVVFLAHTHQFAETREQANAIYPMLLDSLELARQTDVKRFILGSSIAIYGDCGIPYGEDRTFAMRVGESPTLVKFEITVKRVLELLALDYGQPFQRGMSVPPSDPPFTQHELEVITLRSPMMFGPGYYALGSPMGVGAHVAAGRIPMFKGHPGYAGLTVEQLWPIACPIPASYVKNNGDCIKTAMLADKLQNHIYNISSNFDCNARTQFDALVAAAPDCVDRMGISRDDLPDESHDIGFDSGLFAKDFGWSPKFDLEAALADYIGWLKDHPI